MACPILWVHASNWHNWKFLFEVNVNVAKLSRVQSCLPKKWFCDTYTLFQWSIQTSTFRLTQQCTDRNKPCPAQPANSHPIRTNTAKTTQNLVNCTPLALWSFVRFSIRNGTVSSVSQTFALLFSNSSYNWRVDLTSLPPLCFPLCSWRSSLSCAEFAVVPPTAGNTFYVVETLRRSDCYDFVWHFERTTIELALVLLAFLWFILPYVFLATRPLTNTLWNACHVLSGSNKCVLQFIQIRTYRYVRYH